MKNVNINLEKGFCFLNDLIIEKELGKGSFGRVMKCYKKENEEKKFALKEIVYNNDEELANCYKEALIMKSLDQRYVTG